MGMNVRSRILEHLSKDCIRDLFKVCDSKSTTNNNKKVEAMILVLNKYNIDYVELGPGTNRLAILIDNFVFKIALDRWGIQDNINEFIMSQELQPFVIKVYETNDLIAVTEYVTVISQEEFLAKEAEIKDILGTLAEGYLLGDVGFVKKNFCNWGYRDNGELAILDFAYIYRVIGDELLCSKDGEILDYDTNFHNLYCPKCKTKSTFIDIRRKIPMEYEKRENDMGKQLAYCVTEAVTYIKDETDKQIINEVENKEEPDMGKNKYYYEEEETVVDSLDNYEEALAKLSMINQPELETPVSDLVETTIVEELIETEDVVVEKTTNIKVYRPQEEIIEDIRVEDDEEEVLDKLMNWEEVDEDTEFEFELELEEDEVKEVVENTFEMAVNLVSEKKDEADYEEAVNIVSEKIETINEEVQEEIHEIKSDTESIESIEEIAEDIIEELPIEDDSEILEEKPELLEVVDTTFSDTAEETEATVQKIYVESETDNIDALRAELLSDIDADYDYEYDEIDRMKNNRNKNKNWR